ncbi:phage tail assembly chaperone [Leminorella grimontii]|uniref:phage tail assembly chaperone n=1 Tax=Leminorella grimontii TaxID=82981 RepID=UPI00322001D3
MQVETFIISNREYTAKKMNAFDAGRFLLKIKNVAAPALTAFSQADSSDDVNLLDLFSGLDEEAHEKIIFPILAASAVYSIEDKRKIASISDMNMCFNVDTLLDFYLLVWEVLKLNFAPFIERASAHFGFQDSVPAGGE